MCDYSLEHAKSRPAVQGERLMTKDLGRGTIGFIGANDNGFTSFDSDRCTCTAVCLKPGTELVFDQPVQARWGVEKFPATARFTQRDVNIPMAHHDILEFPGAFPAMYLNHVQADQYATVLQMPVDPQSKRTTEEREGTEERSPRELEPIV